MIFQNNKIVEVKVCKHCQNKFEITLKDLKFYEKLSPIFAGIKYSIPTPKLCPDCRQQRRMSFRNERKLYKRKCNATGENIISIYSPDKPYKVYNQNFRWSDKWDAMDYGMDIDFNKSFIDQYNELVINVPKRDLIRGGNGSVNSDFANGIGKSIDCYLMFDSTDIEKCYYGNANSFSSYCVDCTGISKCENCYELIDCVNCFKLFYSQNCVNCSSSSYLYNCEGCESCFGCVGLNNQKYHIFNKKYDKHSYEKELEKLLKKGYSKSEFHKYTLNFPNINLVNINSLNVLGDKIYNSNNVIESFNVADSSNIAYSSVVFNGCDNVYDVFVCLKNSLNIYEGIIINKRCNNLLFCNDCWNECTNIYYCSESKAIKNCILCTGLVHKEYCILNKQYEKSEYECLVPKIVEKMIKDGEWGEFFPASISPFGYNETPAYELFPLSRSSVIPVKTGIYKKENSLLNKNNEANTSNHLIDSGLNPEGRNPFLHGLTFNWSDYEQPFPKVDKIITASKLPLNISDIPDDILNRAIECEITKKPFRIIKQELNFYKKHNLPIPRRHPDQRHLDRIALKNPRKLFSRICDKCGKEIKTTYAPEKPEIVYCEDCYISEIY